MGTIPAKYLSQRIRTDLSMILDPVVELPDRDYRYFADRNGLVPQITKWLDSQKVQNDTSSICKILSYLIDEKGDGFTVYTVYKTLLDMGSDGQRVILEGMPDIRRLYNQGSRPGQENAEPPSFEPPTESFRDMRLDRNILGSLQMDSNGLPPPPSNGHISPPPPYDDPGSQRSEYLAVRGNDPPRNNVGAGCGPVEHSDIPAHRDYPNGSEVRARPAPGSAALRRGGGSGGSSGGGSCQPAKINNLSACENSFHSDSNNTNMAARDNPAVRMGQREAGEYSCRFDGHSGSQMSSSSLNDRLGSPPNYLESQQQRMASATTMEELKLPLEGPVVQADAGSGSVPVWNIPPESSDHRGGMTGQQVHRPFSFPRHQSPSYKSYNGASRPVSDASYYSHSGACNCPVDLDSGNSWTASNFSLVSTGPEFDRSQDNRPVTAVDDRGRPVRTADARCEGREDDCICRQPEVEPSPVSSSLGNERTLQSARPYMNLQPSCHWSTISSKTMNRNGPSYHFVFIVAGDMEETEQWHHQLRELLQGLKRSGIAYIMVSSSSQWPEVCLPQHVLDKLPPLGNDFIPQQKFIWTCFKQAAKVLMLISPGYLLYADAYSDGADRETTFQQKLIRKIQEKLKKEFFSKERAFRIWPVLLLETNAVRVHIPSFLTESMFYCFPRSRSSEDIMLLLREDSNRSRASS